MSPPTVEELHDAATQYAEMGFRVFPLVPRKKHPATTNGCKDATDDLDQIDAWWGQGQAYNVGIATDGLFVLDVDTLDDNCTPNPYVSTLNGDAESLDAAPCVQTRKDGHHWYFRQPQTGRYRNSTGKLADHVDTRADGGYVVAPPSVFEPSKQDDGPAGRWQWLPERDLDRVGSLPTMPAWLIDRLDVTPPKAPSSQSLGIAKGNRNGTLYQMARRMRDAGFVQTAIDAAIQAENITSCNPPLDRDEVSKIAGSAATNESEDSEKDPAEPVEFKRISCADLASGNYEVEYLIDDTLVAGQPFLLCGPHKALKTSILIDAAISLSTGTRFLGRLDVPRARRVFVMTGESGLATIQETAKRVSEAKGLTLANNQNLIWSPDVPRFGNIAHAEALGQMLEEDEIEVLAIDPAYLCMPGADAGNLMIQGELLRAMSKVCTDRGVTLIVAHHTKKNTLTPKNEPLELSDIAWAGFAEFARQWWLVNRREKYAEGSGEHALWLSVGGSAGHSALWALDAHEGVRDGNQQRYWDVSVSKGHALMAEQQRDERDSKAEEREAKQTEKLEHDRTKVWSALGRLGTQTATTIAGAAGLSNGRTAAALGWLVAEKMAEEAPVERSNGQKYSGYRLTQEGRNSDQNAA